MATAAIHPNLDSTSPQSKIKIAKSKMLWRWLVYAVALGLLWFCVHLACVAVDGLSCQPSPADAAVILGNKVEADGRPSPMLQGAARRRVESVSRGPDSYVDYQRLGGTFRLSGSGGHGRSISSTTASNRRM